MVWFLWVSIFTVLMSATMIGCGVFFVKNPPKEINSLIGYRTRRSTIDQEHWDFAHQYAGRVWIRCGIANAITFLLLAGGCLLLQEQSDFFQGTAGMVLTYLQFVPLLLVIPMTEHALRSRFPDDPKK